MPSNEAVREAIEAGAGATIVSRHVVASAISSGTLKAIPVDLPLREYALVRHRDRHETLAQQTLVAHLTTTADAVASEAPVAVPIASSSRRPKRKRQSA